MESFTFRGLIIFCSTCLLILAAMNGSSVEASKQFKVGDHMGWQQPSSNNSEVYTQWAINKRFHVGDSLSFEYQNDSVLMVDKWDYYHCNTDNPISSFNDGNTVINLGNSGLFYFISGVPDHCNKGQKLLIRVMGLHPKAESPPPIANPPDVVGLAPGQHSSSGLVVTVTLSSVFVGLVVTVVTLVLKVQERDSSQTRDDLKVQERDSGQTRDENEGPLK